MLRESELLRLIQIEADKIKKQILKKCPEIKRKAKEEVEKISNKNSMDV